MRAASSSIRQAWVLLHTKAIWHPHGFCKPIKEALVLPAADSGGCSELTQGCVQAVSLHFKWHMSAIVTCCHNSDHQVVVDSEYAEAQVYQTQGEGV